MIKWWQENKELVESLFRNTFQLKERDEKAKNAHNQLSLVLKSRSTLHCKSNDLSKPAWDSLAEKFFSVDTKPADMQKTLFSPNGFPLIYLHVDFWRSNVNSASCIKLLVLVFLSPPNSFCNTFAEALSFFCQLLKKNPHAWLLYLSGRVLLSAVQCCLSKTKNQ